MIRARAATDSNNEKNHFLPRSWLRRNADVIWIKQRQGPAEILTLSASHYERAIRQQSILDSDGEQT